MVELESLNQLPSYRSRLSFQPLIRVWKEIILNEPYGAGKTYEYLLNEFSKFPELLDPIDDFQLLEKHKRLIEQALATVFPVSRINKEKLYAVIVPFSYKTIFSSQFFKQLLVEEKRNYVRGVDEQTERNMAIAKLSLAYKMILEKFYGIQLAGEATSICSYPDPKRNLHAYLELELDSQFTDVSTSFELPVLPENLLKGCCRITDVPTYPELLRILPLDQFVFDGMMIVRIHDVTEKETFHNIKRILGNLDSISDPDLFVKLQQQIKYLVDLPDIKVAITSFKINTHIAALSHLYTSNSVLLRNVHLSSEKMNLCKQLTEAFKASPKYLHVTEMTEKKLKTISYLKHLSSEGWTSAFLFPLHSHDSVVGCLEIFSIHPTPLDRTLLAKVEPVISLLELALQKSTEHIENQINKLIREQFTAVQSSVEWKFTNAAYNYLSRLQKGEDAKMEPIVFDQVYPLYGAIDIRNSSGERNLAVQQDMIEQLLWVKKILVAARSHFEFPLLNEVESRIDHYIATVSNFLFTDDEEKVHVFLKGEASELLKHLKETVPYISNEIDEYFATIDERLNLLNNHRKKFEDSVTQINHMISRFLEKEQAAAQKIYPHYFERFVTDGVDFNLYIGQSISPERKFNTI